MPYTPVELRHVRLGRSAASGTSATRSSSCSRRSPTASRRSGASAASSPTRSRSSRSSSTEIRSARRCSRSTLVAAEKAAADAMRGREARGGADRRRGAPGGALDHARRAGRARAALRRGAPGRDAAARRARDRRGVAARGGAGRRCSVGELAEPAGHARVRSDLARGGPRHACSAQASSERPDRRTRTWTRSRSRRRARGPICRQPLPPLLEPEHGFEDDEPPRSDFSWQQRPTAYPSRR